MPTDSTTRQTSQALFRHLPGQPYVWKDKGLVIGQPPYSTRDLDVPPAWVRLRLRQLVRPFAERRSAAGGPGPELAIIDQIRYSLVEPADLRAARFPRTTLCPTCGWFATADPGRPTPRCPDHQTDTDQFGWVEVHNCGHLAELRPLRCANGCSAGMRLRGFRNQRTSTWVWECRRCRQRAGGVTRRCPACRDGTVRVQRANQKATYYPQHITVLNPPRLDDRALVSDERVYDAAIAQALGLLAPGKDALREAVSGPPDPEAEAKDALAKLGIDANHPLYQQLLAQALTRAAPGVSWADEIAALRLTDDQREFFGDECLQLSLASVAEPLTRAALRAEAAEDPASQPLLARYDRYDTLLTKHKMVDVTLLRGLPMAFIVAGYTRGDAHAKEDTRFQFFPSSGGKSPMYGIRTQTEGLLFRLDPDAIVDWLVDSGVVPDPRSQDDWGDARRWLLRVCEPSRTIFEPPSQRIARAVTGLVHSVSHRMMAALAARSGLNVDSLAEYLFPVNGAFLVYANTRSEFTLGGLEHVFRYDLADCLEQLTAETRCVFDPPCATSFGGACAACMYVAEVACARFNNSLSRNYLFGSAVTGAVTTQPGLGDEASDDSGDSDPTLDTDAEVTWSAFWPR
jgi:hypothetical protein